MPSHHSARPFPPLEITLADNSVWSKPHLPRALRIQGTRGSLGFVSLKAVGSAGTPAAADSPQGQGMGHYAALLLKVCSRTLNQKGGIEGWEASTDRRTALSESQAPPPSPRDSGRCPPLGGNSALLRKAGLIPEQPGLAAVLEPKSSPEKNPAGSRDYGASLSPSPQRTDSLVGTPAHR